ncbi:acyl-CoA dehydrogenase family protein [Mesorhizobium amorphae]|uniref:Medium-chain specific acyl-CoA dehydrogenase, mitochondrial n=1 Tax=Mesorhizobium amorphae CCNWGS0123 TaxID=1082933 RepID=G6YI88_9HYPH|nr:acyl-CoA dehydrogenase family protein [Mesorhizobium amorphae]ANT54893.1 acyl-CoA dehydrogenase [Mesorhizobium amorphae CCNWGS0123]EHH06693.1 acyl-CoA dehydrogenase [Mesorhizobium amorphae CCNWGS0123]
MDFRLTDEQRLIYNTAREFCEKELIPHEVLLENSGELPRELEFEIRHKAIAVGLHACNMPESVGGGGLDCVSLTLVEKGLTRASSALADCVHRPNKILAACEGDQISHFLQPVMRGEKRECIAMTEPDAGSDLKGMKTRADRDGPDWVINGTKHFITNAQRSQFVIVFAVTGKDETPTGTRKRISCFLVDLDTPGLDVGVGYHQLGHRGETNEILHFNNVRVGSWQMVGGEGEGFKVVTEWLGEGRLTVAAVCQARAERAFEVAVAYAAQRKQFGQPIGKFQGIGFPLADMAIDIRLGDMLLMNTAWRVDQKFPSVAQDCAMAKVWCSEMLGRVADQAIQTCGGMGLMADLPLERIYRDARGERIWEGTSEIQRLIISRELMRENGA